MQKTDTTLIFMVGWSLGFIVGGSIWSYVADRDLKDQAIKAKIAHYDPITGEFKFNIVDEDSTK